MRGKILSPFGTEIYKQAKILKTSLGIIGIFLLPFIPELTDINRDSMDHAYISGIILHKHCRSQRSKSLLGPTCQCDGMNLSFWGWEMQRGIDCLETWEGVGSGGPQKGGKSSLVAGKINNSVISDEFLPLI